MTVQIPVRLVTEHTATISSMLLGGARSVLPFVRKSQGGVRISRRLNAPSAALVDAFNAWAGVARPAGDLPPPLMVAQTALSVVSDLTAQCPYPLLGVLNQGLRIVIHERLPVGGKLNLSGELVDASDDGYRARIHSHVEVGTDRCPNAVSIDAFAAVVLKKRPDGGASDRVEPHWETVGHWQAAADEGVKFFLLTGDFNPIHTLPAVARRTRFKGCIMHGYGAFSQIYACLENNGWRIADIETRFVKPLPLPSPLLLIQIARERNDEGRLPFRLTDADGNLYQVGSFVPVENA